MTDRLDMERYMSRMPKLLSARNSLFMYVQSHAQLQYYFNLIETRRATNHSGLLDAPDLPRVDNVVEIHPIDRPISRRRP
jgi:hypothetical protein